MNHTTFPPESVEELTDYFSELKENFPQSQWLHRPFEHVVFDDNGNEAGIVEVSFAGVGSADEIRRHPEKLIAGRQAGRQGR